VALLLILCFINGNETTSKWHKFIGVGLYSKGKFYPKKISFQKHITFPNQNSFDPFKYCNTWIVSHLNAKYLFYFESVISTIFFD
jgi:hypothetical protein